MEQVNTTVAETSTPNFGVFSHAILNHSDGLSTLLVPQNITSIYYKRKRGVGKKGRREPNRRVDSIFSLFDSRKNGRKEVEIVGRRERGRDEESPPRAQTFSSPQL